MASNLSLILLLLLVSLSLTSGYFQSTREDESLVVATGHDQRSSMTVVEDLVKTRSLRSLLSSPKLVAVIKKGSSGSRGFRRSSKSAKKIGALDAAVVGYIIGAIVGVIVILAVMYCLLRVYIKHQDKKAQSIEQGILTKETNELSEPQASKTEKKMNETSEIQTSKTEEIHRSSETHIPTTEETQTSKTEIFNGSSETQNSKI